MAGLVRLARVTASAPARPTGRRVVRGLAAVLVWLAVAAPVTTVVFLNSSRETVVAGHDAVVSPSADGWAVVDLGPFLPALRYPAPGRVGVQVELGRTPLTSYGELTQRYAFIAAQPEGQIAKVSDLVRQMAYESALVGATTGLVPLAVWWLVGPRRRSELRASAGSIARTGGVLTGLAAVLAVAAIRPWQDDTTVRETWSPLADVVPDGVRLPAQAQPLEVEGGLLSSGTQQLVASAVDSYRRSLGFYQEAVDDLAEVAPLLRQPGEEETVALLVSDRHDNIGMDPVARAVFDAGGASVLFDAGDDTSTGSSWEAFSLESLHDAFEDVEQRYFVAGNHDEGAFIAGQAGDLGFTVLDGEVVEAADGIRLLGVADPRSSGLGNWRQETGLSFADVGDALADTACEADAAGERISTLLVHDANLGDEALERGCADLVLAGHLHDIEGPDLVTGPEGQAGYSFTTGTTGGAAYAIAIGTKPRREATMSLVTYRAGRPVAIQSLVLSPLGVWRVGEVEELATGGEDAAARRRAAGRHVGGGGGI